LTVPEIRILKEGQKRIQEEKEAQRKAMQNSSATNSPSEVSDTRTEIEKSKQQSTKQLVEDINNQ